MYLLRKFVDHQNHVNLISKWFFRFILDGNILWVRRFI